MVVWIGSLYTCKNYEGFYYNQIRLSLDNILKLTQPKKKVGGKEVTCINASNIFLSASPVGFVRVLISSTATL